jgi:hypothetical protein
MVVVGGRINKAGEAPEELSICSTQEPMAYLGKGKGTSWCGVISQPSPYSTSHDTR